MRLPRSGLFGVGLTLAVSAEADTPNEAIRVREGSAVAAPVQLGGGLEDRGAGLRGFVEDLVDAGLAAHDVLKDHPAEAAALPAHSVVGGEAVAAIKADHRASVLLEEDRDLVV